MTPNRPRATPIIRDVPEPTSVKTYTPWGGVQVDICIPLKLTGSQNAREHWRVASQRKKNEKYVADAYLLKARKLLSLLKLPYRVRIERQGPRLLDSDNVSGSAKQVRDRVAAALDCDDGDESKITFDYGQQRGRCYAVWVYIEGRATPAAGTAGRETT